MTEIVWDTKARDFLRKLPRDISKRIFNKIDIEIRQNVERYLKTLVGKDYYKIRVGDYRIFVDYYRNEDRLFIRAIRHRRNAYKFILW